MREDGNNQSNLKKRFVGWWKTDCVICQRSRLYLLWALIMLVVYFYVWK